MKFKFGKMFSNKKIVKSLAVLLGLTLTTSVIVLPTVFYGTANNNLLYLDPLGNVVRDDSDNQTPTLNEYKGDFKPGISYKKGDVVSYNQVKFENDNLLEPFSRVYNRIMYVFNQDWTGSDFSKAPVSPYKPDNLTTINLPLDQFILDQNAISSYMAPKFPIQELGRASITGKFTGVGEVYDPRTKPGLAVVNDQDSSIELKYLDEFFTWSKDGASDANDDNQVENSYPLPGDNQQKQNLDRYAYNKAGMYAIQLNNTPTGSKKLVTSSSWYSSIDGFDTGGYKDLGLGRPIGIWPYFSRLSSDDSKTFVLNDENLGLYIYSKTSAYPTATRYATSTAITNANYSGFYQGDGEPLVNFKEKNKDQNREIGFINNLQNAFRYDDGKNWSSNQTIYYPSADGTPAHETYNIGQLASMGAYIYSRKGWLSDEGNDFRNMASDPMSPVRNISYYNGIFSLDKPSTALSTSESPNISWYVPYASTNFSIKLNQDKINEATEKYLASDAMNVSVLSTMFTPYLYNAIPSTFYGSNLKITADNTTGTIWVDFTSGPAVNAVNGGLYKVAQTESSSYSKPNWLAGMTWYYYHNDGVDVPSRYWYNNLENPVSEITMADPIQYSFAITGFEKIKPTMITDTTNPKGDEFIPGISENNGTKYGPYRLTGGSYSKLSPSDFIKKENEKDESERYSELLDGIFENLVYNKGPSFGQDGTGDPFIQRKDLVRISDVVPYNFLDQRHPEWGGRLQFSVTLKSYFSKEGLYVSGSGGFPSVPVVFGGFKAVPGPTSINANYNLNSMIPGGVKAFNEENLGQGAAVSYPSDYLNEKLVSGDETIYNWLEKMVYRWSNNDPFKGVGADQSNENFLPDNFMIKNLPDVGDDDVLPFTIAPDNVSFDNFTGILKITPTFNKYFNVDGNLIEGVQTTLGTITISGFQTVNGSTYIPPVVQALSVEQQPSGIASEVDEAGNYIGQELYKIAWNESLNLPTKDYNLPPYTANQELTSEQINEIKRVIDIRVDPDNPSWVDNIDGSLKFAVAFRRMFNKNGIPVQIDSQQLWPEDWKDDKPDDNVFIVTAYGYSNSPGPTTILKDADGANRNVVINQPNFQPSEFIANDATAGYPILRSIISGNLKNLPSNFTQQDIVLSVDDFNSDNNITWDPVSEGNPLPLVPDNQDGSITVQVYLKTWYSDNNAKLCNMKDDNRNLPYTISDQNNSGDSTKNWSFKISGFMKTNAKGASNLFINDQDYPDKSNIANSVVTIDLSNPDVLNFFDNNYPEISKMKDFLPYQIATPSNLRELLLIKNNSISSKNQPYLLMQNIPENIKPFNIVVKDSNIISINNKEGSITFNVTLRQWFTKEPGGITYHPTLSDQSNGVNEYVTSNSIKIIGLKNISGPTMINPNGDNVDSITGKITLTKESTSTEIINGILKDKYINAAPDNVNKLDQYVDFDPTKNQPTVLDDFDWKTYVYVALYKSGGSPYTLAPGSIVEETQYGSYHVNNKQALDEFITWKIKPFYDLEKGSIQLFPMLNTWFGGDEAKIFNQYQSFGAGTSGKPTVNGNTITPAIVSVVEVTGFIAATKPLSFNNSDVYNGESLITELSPTGQSNDTVDLSKFTAQDFVKNPIFNDSILNINIQNKGIVEVLDDPTIDISNIKLSDIVDMTGSNWYKVDELNGTITIKTKQLKYFDGNKKLCTGSVSLVISGFKPSVSAYKTIYIILIITIVALIIVLAIVLARILWVRYNKSRNEYNS